VDADNTDRDADLLLYDSLDINDRLVDGVTLTPRRHYYRDGQSFTSATARTRDF